MCRSSSYLRLASALSVVALVRLQGDIVGHQQLLVSVRYGRNPGNRLPLL
jgi:hypothetical protein